MQSVNPVGGWALDARAGLSVNVSDSAALHDLLTSEPQAFTDTDGRLYVRLHAFHRYVVRNRGERISARQLAQRLGALGLTKHQLAARPPGGGGR